MDMNNANMQAMEYIAQGKMLLAMENFAGALSYFQKAEQEDSSLREAYLNQGECLIMLEHFDEAEDAYHKLLLINKNDGEACYHLGNVAYLKGDDDKGREYYARAVNAGYDDENIYLNTGFMLCNIGKYDEAIAQFNKVLAKNRFNAQALLYKARSYLSMGMNDQAMQALDHMIQLVPEVFEGHHYKLMLLLSMNQAEEADTVADTMLRLFPDDEGAQYDKLLVFEAKGDVQQALRYYEDCFGESDEPFYLIEKGKILSGIDGRIEDAASIFEKIASGEDDLARQAHFFALIAKLSLGKHDDALNHSEALLATKEPDEHYYTALYFRAYCLEQLEKHYDAKRAYEKAIAELRMASMKEPAMLDYYVIRIMALKNIGEKQKALDLANYLLTVNPDMMEALAVRADLYKSMHMDAEAEADLKRIKDNPGVLGGILQAAGVLRM